LQSSDFDCVIDVVSDLIVLIKKLE